MKRRNEVPVSALSLVVLAVLALYLSGWSPITAAGLVLNTYRSANNPPGGAVVEVRGATPAGAATGAETASRPNARSPDAGSWPSYNRTLTSQRYSPLSQINTQTVRGPQGLMPASAITTWKNAPDVPISGGGTWTSYTLDPGPSLAARKRPRSTLPALMSFHNKVSLSRREEEI
jgi:hypothetical protein